VKPTRITVRADVRPTELQLGSRLQSSVSGHLYLEIGDAFFPAKGWGDYVIPVLARWIENAQRLVLAEQAVANTVMDGTYTFSMLRRSGSDEVEVTLRENASTMTGRHTISYVRYLATLRGAAKIVLKELRNLGYTGGGEAGTLQTRLEHLLRLEAEIRTGGLP
jgi:hypothetical protein